MKPGLRLIPAAVSAALLFSAGMVVGESAAPIKDIVLVHGAWVDGAGWKPVYDILIRDGYRVTLVQKPLTSLQGDVAAIKRVPALQTEDCVLGSQRCGGKAAQRQSKL